MEKLSRRDKEKQARETEIIAAAEKLFSKHGYPHVSMDQIAQEADFTKRTVYQYFKDKDDLFYAVVIKGFSRLFSYCQKAFQKGKNGFDKMQQAFIAFHQFHLDFPQTFKMMNQIGTIKKQSTPRQNQFREFDMMMFKEIGRVIQEGQNDGSIRKDINPYDSAFVMAFITTGFFYQLAETGEAFTKNLKLDYDKFIELAIELLSNTLRSN